MKINLIEKFFRKLLELRAYVLFGFAIISLFGIYSFSKVKIDAIPDITNKQVIVNTKTFGIDPAYIEKSVTYPIESELFGVPKLKEMRSLSKFGLSQIIGENFGGGYIEKDNQQKIVRTFANIRDQNDLMNVPIKIDYSGKAIPLHQIVEVRQDYSQLLGSASVGGKEAIIGTVMLQSGSNSNEVLTKVKQEIEKINARNSKFQIELLYDRQFLIDKTIKTVLKNLLEGILLVVAVLCFTLGTLKSGMIVASTIIFSVLILSSCMNLFGIYANLMSLGVIDFGLLVDSSVVLVEYIICHLHNLD